MSRSQRELSIAQRKRKRHVVPVRNNVNDLVGIPWKEERDLRKAIYDSLREQHHHHHPSPSGRRSKLTKSTSPPKLAKDSRAKRSKRLGEAEKEIPKEDEAAISKSPHPRKSRPLPGDLSHQFLFASSYSRSFALLSSRAASRAARRTLARAVATEAPTVEKAAFSRRGRPSSGSTRLQTGRSPKRAKRYGNDLGASIGQDEDVKGDRDFVEMLVENRNGKIVPQANPRASSKTSQTAAVDGLTKSNSPSPVKSTRSLLQQPFLRTASPEKWQDCRGQPVNVQDFVDFLCLYGTSCLDERLAWFMNAPGHRGSVNGNLRPRGTMTNGKGAIRIFPACASPRMSVRPAAAPLQHHKAPVLPVARKTVSTWPIPPPQNSVGSSPERRINTGSALPVEATEPYFNCVHFSKGCEWFSIEETKSSFEEGEEVSNRKEEAQSEGCSEQESISR
ncbi:hypothetical protein Aperf_G00000086745 [Anoplocephala perfoliata]